MLLLLKQEFCTSKNYCLLLIYCINAIFIPDTSLLNYVHMHEIGLLRAHLFHLSLHEAIILFMTSKLVAMEMIMSQSKASGGNKICTQQMMKIIIFINIFLHGVWGMFVKSKCNDNLKG